MIFEIEGVYMEEIKDKDYSLEAVPESARKGFRSMFFCHAWIYLLFRKYECRSKISKWFRF